MTDPAIEAAQRAWEKSTHGLEATAYLAAQEALAPIRAVLDKLAEDTFPPCEFGKRIDLYEKAISALSPLCYTSGELANG